MTETQLQTVLGPALAHRRGRARRDAAATGATATTLGDTIPDQGDGPGRPPGAQEMRGQLAEAIERMPEREKIVLTLYYFENLTLAEIGEVLGGDREPGQPDPHQGGPPAAQPPPGRPARARLTGRPPVTPPRSRRSVGRSRAAESPASAGPASAWRSPRWPAPGRRRPVGPAVPGRCAGTAHRSTRRWSTRSGRRREPWLPGNRGIEYATVAGPPVARHRPGPRRLRRPGGRARCTSRSRHPDGLRSSYSFLAAIRGRGGRPGRRAARWSGRRRARLHLGVRRGDAYLDPASPVGRRSPAVGSAWCPSTAGRSA